MTSIKQQSESESWKVVTLITENGFKSFKFNIINKLIIS